MSHMLTKWLARPVPIAELMRRAHREMNINTSIDCYLYVGGQEFRFWPELLNPFGRRLRELAKTFNKYQAVVQLRLFAEIELKELAAYLTSWRRVGALITDGT